jgi:prepilin-type N-terminal cleavage/methylation domain-containing protein
MEERMGREDGFTLIEVLIAALILVIGSFAAFGLLRAAALNNQRAKATQVALDRAQQELEVLRGLPDEQLALTEPPPPSSNPKDPGYRVVSGTFYLNRNRTGEHPELVVKNGSLYGGGFITAGSVDPGPTPFTSGNVKGKIYRYIVWRNDASCPESTCPGTQDYKQVVVAVRLDKAVNQASEQGYVEVQSTFINPKDSAKNDPIPGGNGVTTAQQFFLSDTRCSPSGSTTRQEVVESHTLHNTLGSCASTNGTAPDALVLGAPPDPYPGDPTQPLEYDYSTDYPLSVISAAAKGIQLRRDDSSGCHEIPTGTSVPQWQVHRWVTDPMASQLKMSERVTLVIKTRAINETGYTGSLCIYLFDRAEPKGVPEDSYFLNKQTGTKGWSWSPSSSQWPREWFEIQVPMLFNGPYPLEPGHRLGLALSVNGKTGGDAVSLMYDHPSFRARLEVETPTPIASG